MKTMMYNHHMNCSYNPQHHCCYDNYFYPY